MSEWITDYIVKNQYSRPGLKLLGVKGVVMHWTATPGATAENEAKFFDGSDGGGGRYASAHIFVDRDSARLIIPLNEVAYHANEKPCKVAKLSATASYYKGGGANLTTIGVEMCVEKNGTIHPDTVSRAVNVVAALCKTYKLDPLKDIYRHYDITGKNCPAPWVSDSTQFTTFKKRVDAEVNPPKKVKTSSISKSTSATYKVVKGDTLWQIATDNGMTVTELQALNKGVDLSPLQIGTILRLSSNTYTVKKGDTLWGIAKDNGLSVSKLKALNKGKDLEPLQVGEVLLLK